MMRRRYAGSPGGACAMPAGRCHTSPGRAAGWGVDRCYRQHASAWRRDADVARSGSAGCCPGVRGAGGGGGYAGAAHAMARFGAQEGRLCRLVAGGGAGSVEFGALRLPGETLDGLRLMGSSRSVLWRAAAGASGAAVWRVGDHAVGSGVLAACPRRSSRYFRLSYFSLG